MSEEARHEQTQSPQSEHDANRQHDHGDAEAQADDHEHEAQYDDGEVLHKATDSRKHPTDAKAVCHHSLPRLLVGEEANRMPGKYDGNPRLEPARFPKTGTARARPARMPACARA